MIIKVKDIASAIEKFAPRSLQESYDNTGMQIGDPEAVVNGVLLCIDVNEDVVREAEMRQCNMIVSHHPLIFSGLKRITGETAVERIVMEALEKKISIYSAHTNLDSAFNGVSYEIAHMIGLDDIRPLEVNQSDEKCGLGVIGSQNPVPAIEFLRRIKELFNVKSLRYSSQSPQLVIRKVAVCGGSGASFISRAIELGADVMVTGDVKYHDFTTFALDILIADIGHYESELCTKKIFSKIIRESYPECVTYFAECDRNPINYI